MYTVSVLINGEKTSVAIYNESYGLIASIESESIGNADKICELSIGLMSEVGIDKQDVKHVGIVCDCASADLLASLVEEKIGIPTLAEGTFNAEALGEAYLSGDKSFLVSIRISDTVECATVIEKKLFKGHSGLGGRIAHMVIDVGGYECECGRRGCFEAYAGIKGLRRICADAGVDGADIMTPALLFTMKSGEAKLAQKQYTEHLAAAITNVINFFQPDELVLEGDFLEAGEALTSPMTEIILREQYSRTMDNKCNVRRANDKKTTALLGAALLQI